MEVNAIPSKLEITRAQLDLCVGLTAVTETESIVSYYRDDEWHSRHGDNWRYYRDGPCRDVITRERRGEEIAVKHVRHCE
jgi:hypothetical protein